jgi:3'-5' exoribonuclease
MPPKHPLKGAFVTDLRPGQRITAFFLARQKQLEPFRDRSKGEFLTLILGDRTGQILARVWEGAPELAQTFEEDDIVKIAGDVEEYLGRAQLIIHKLRPAQDNEFDLADFLPATAKDVPALLAQTQAAVDSLRDRHLGALIRYFYADSAFIERLTQAPAARRLHHAYLGGLLEHTAEMLALADTLLGLYPELHADLLRAGVLLHAVGKLREYAWTRDIDYTDEGRLIGHVVLVDELVTEALRHFPDFPPELSLRLRHMLISYRGRYEWGAPRQPMTLEAAALHHIENLNAQLSRFRDLLAARRESDQPWTEFDRLLGRALYAGGEMPGQG